MSTVAEVRGLTRGGGSALTALVSGSMVLAGKVCGCVPAVLGWVWGLASIDVEATAAAQAKADRAAKAKQTDDEDEEVRAPRVAPVRRPALEALGMLALGGGLAAGALGTVGALVWPYVQMLTPWRGVIATVGGLAWMAAAWMLAPPATPADEDEAEEELDEDQEQEAPASEADQGMALLLHIVRDLSDAEASKRAGVHLDVLLDSATTAGLVPEGTQTPALRAWLEAAGLPVEDKLGMRIDGKPVTRVGVRIDAVTGVLGMSPTALLEARLKASAPAPSEAPAPAVLTLIPGGLHGPSPAPPLAGAAEPLRKAR
ncbi:hypothetical protein ACFUJU_28835 [Streptomyces sp. NPDC057235]|uniref:hypothetical protein n=1 Tax=Streptomyces sp. NPDC057235 TaxID=3346058 RepID=UPI003641E337